MVIMDIICLCPKILGGVGGVITPKILGGGIVTSRDK